jgi:hypothetical protein
VIQSDSIKSKTIEEGIREGIAELFWGSTKKIEEPPAEASEELLRDPDGPLSVAINAVQQIVPDTGGEGESEWTSALAAALAKLAAPVPERLKSILEDNGWTGTEFQGPPNRQALLEQLLALKEAVSTNGGAKAEASKRQISLSWEWARGKPSCVPPRENNADNKLVNYAQYCKMILTDKEERKEAVKTFRYCANEEAKREMDKLLQVSLKKMQLPPEVRYTPQAEKSGLNGCMHLMFPSVFHFVANLQRQKRHFAILFRSFGADHEAIRMEWNAFCI